MVGETEFYQVSPIATTDPPGWKPRLYVSQDGRRYTKTEEDRAISPVRFDGQTVLGVGGV